MAAQTVRVTVRVNTTGAARAGFGKALVLGYSATFPDRTRSYRNTGEMQTDGFAADSHEVRAATQLFGQSPRPEQVAIGRGALPPTLKYQVGIETVIASHEYKLSLEGEGFDDTDVAITTEAADLTFLDADVNAGTETFTEVAHGMVTGDGPFRWSNSGGALPVGLAVDTNYWIIKITADTFRLASTRANAIAETNILITSAAGGGTHTLRRVQNDVICAHLVQALNDVADKNFTATQVTGAGETDYIEITATAAGDWFSVELAGDNVLDNMSLQQTNSDPGVATDLAAIANADKTFYAVVTPFTSKAIVLATAAWVESNAKFYWADHCDSASATTAYSAGVTTDLGSELNDLSLKRTHWQYHHSPAEMVGTALAGKLLPLDAGGWTAMHKTLALVTPSALTTTQRNNLEARRGNYYATEGNRSKTFGGMVGDQDFGFADVTVSLDFAADDLGAAIAGVLEGRDIVAYDDPDIAAIESAMKGTAKRCTPPTRKIFRLGTTEVSVPKVADVDESTRATRVLEDCVLSGQLAGAVHTVLVDLVATF